MPFVLSESFDESGLPEYLKAYWPLIGECSDREAHKTQVMFHDQSLSEIGKVCFLTVQESFVETGKTQRRPGLHVDCPGYVKVRDDGNGGGSSSDKQNKGDDEKKKKTDGSVEKKCGDAETGAEAAKAKTGDERVPNTGVPLVPKEGSGVSRRYTSHRWGLGGCQVVPPQPHLENADDRFQHRSFVFHGGIYMASNVDDSCRVWNCKIVPEEEEEEEEDKSEEKSNAKFSVNFGPKGKGYFFCVVLQRYRVFLKKVLHEREEKMQEKMKMT